MLRSDRLKARFRPEDRVEFTYRSEIRQGVISRLNPKRAHVVGDDELEFRVPYENLSHCAPQDHQDDQRRLEEVAREAERLLRRHGLRDWSFQYDDALGRAGVCIHGIKVIGLSRLYGVHATDTQVRDTILHEIAHALAGPHHNHDRFWKDLARSIGCTSERCHNVQFAPWRYIVTCPNCRWAIRRNVRRRGTLCRTCRCAVKYQVHTRKAWKLAQAKQRGPDHS